MDKLFHKEKTSRWTKIMLMPSDKEIKISDESSFVFPMSLKISPSKIKIDVAIIQFSSRKQSKYDDNCNSLCYQ